MTTNPVRPGHAVGGYSQGAQVPAGPADRRIPVQRGPGAPNAFDFVLRGYDRNQVDERISELLGQVTAATERSQVMTTRLAEQQHRADRAEGELRAALSAAQPAAGKPDAAKGFGYRAERLLRMAEAEANDIRGAAIKEATETVERARAAAEAHRHEIEQNLIMRATALDQKANEVAVELREREHAATAELSAAHAEAESVRGAARREMEQARKNVEIVARDMRAQAERWAEQHRSTAAAEVARLVELRDRMQHDLGELSGKLLAAVQTEQSRAVRQPAEASRPDESPDPTPDHAGRRHRRDPGS